MTDFKKRSGETYQNPTGKSFPHSGFKDAMWVHMTPKHIMSQTTANRGGTIRYDSVGPTFKFLAPENIAETITHSWEAYDSMQSRLMEKVKAGVKLSEDVRALKALGKGAGSTGKKVLKDLASGKDVGNTAMNTLSGLPLATRIPNAKVDTPLVYTTSGRREWNLTFFLASSSDPKKEIVEPIKELMKYSSPGLKKGSIFIDFPWVFQISTQPGELILAKAAALESVQPTWKTPYINGLPTNVELTLTFKDLSPLFRQTIEIGGLVTIIKPPT